MRHTAALCAAALATLPAAAGSPYAWQVREDARNLTASIAKKAAAAGYRLVPYHAGQDAASGFWALPAGDTRTREQLAVNHDGAAVRVIPINYPAGGAEHQPPGDFRERRGWCFLYGSAANLNAFKAAAGVP
jgi:hypothetical protein